MIYEIYIIDVETGKPLIDRTYRKTHLGVENSLISGLLHAIYIVFEVEMEVGNVKSVQTKDYKLTYLKYENFLIASLVDIELNETKVKSMLESIGKSFHEGYKEYTSRHSAETTHLPKFIPKLDAVILETISNLFLEDYPKNVVSLVDFLDENYSLEYQELIGKYLAKRILADKYSNLAKMRNLRKELSRFTVIGEFDNNFIELSACPFCRKKDTDIPICNFTTGFINGMMESNSWVEDLCSGRGDKSCTFVKKS